MKEKNLIFIFKPYRINFINKKEIENYCKKIKMKIIKIYLIILEIKK
jgi:hypothetical protein